MQSRKWVLLVSVGLLIWGVVSEKVAIVLLAIGFYFALRTYARRGPIGQLSSVPPDNTAPSNVPLIGADRIGPAGEGAAHGPC